MTTWISDHESSRDAVEHAKLAYGDAVGQWRRANVGNAEEFVKHRLANES